jgi:ddrB-like ParB superfamily domain/Family of unknown function (DUF6496)
MQVYKQGEIIGKIISRKQGGLIDVDYDGTVLTVDESTNELTEVYATGGKTDSYKPVYEVRYTDTSTGSEVTELRTENEEEAINLREHLHAQGKRQPHVQYSFESGGQTQAQKDKIGYVMNEFKNGELYSGSGHKVTSRKQAVAIAMSESEKAEFGLKTPSQDVQIPALLGRKKTIKLANKEKHSGQYAIVELNDIKASHNEQTFSDTEDYPLDPNGENINDRNYSDDKNAQAKVNDIAQNLEPDLLITTSADPEGTPIITTDGIVVSGNNRTMSLKLALTHFQTNYKEYVNYLIEEIDSFGLVYREKSPRGKGYRYVFGSQSGETKSFDSPVLVRIDYDFTNYDTTELSKYNKDAKKTERPIDQAIKLGKMLKHNEQCQNVISEVVGEYETFTDFYSSITDQRKVKDSFLNCNILTEGELPRYFGDAGFTPQGKEIVENLLAGLVLSKDALVQSEIPGAKKFRQTLITSLPVLTANLKLGPDSLMEYISEAILLEAKISSSKLSFKDYVAQQDLFGEKPNVQALYLNRLLDSGRNNFKKSIEGYNSSVINNQGANMFGDAPSIEEIFKVKIIDKVPEESRKIIERYYSGSTKETTMTDTPQEDEIVYVSYMNKDKGYTNDKKFFKGPDAYQQATEWGRSEFEKWNPDFISYSDQTEMDAHTGTTSETPKKNPFVDGNFFADNPDKVLAETSQGKSRWQKPITIYKGSLEDVSRIPVEENFLMAFEPENPVISVEQKSVFDATDKDTEVYDNLQKALEQGPKDEVKKSRRKKKKALKKATSETVYFTGDEQTKTLRETYDECNPEITLDELQVYLWYRKQVGRPVTNPEWFEIAEITENELYNDPALVTNWVNNQHLFYYDGKLLPAYLYLAENVYEKRGRLMAVKEEETSGKDHFYIIETYGQAVYDAQVEAFNQVFQRKDQKRLLIKPEGDDQGLKLSPISSYARNFVINTLADEVPFKYKKVTATKDRYYGKPDFLAVKLDKWKFEVFDSLSLTEAFMLWLRIGEPVFRKGVTYADIIKVFVLSANKPRSKAVLTKRDDGTTYYTPDQLKIKIAEDDAWARLKSKSKTEGERLFAVFLHEHLTLNDKLRLEYDWNMTFNGYVPIDYNKVPVAFRMNKFIDGAPLDVLPEKREAVAFNFSEGSGLIAYDVGVGKTPSAIFTICQFLDSGYASKPALIVPNQTYKQWISEFKKFANHIPINDFYNLSGPYLDEWMDADGKVKPVPPGSVSLMTYEAMKQIGFNEDTIQRLKPDLTAILLQEDPEEVKKAINYKPRSDKQEARRMEQLNTKVEKQIGKGLSKTVINIEDLGFDFVGFDEAHKCKKVFSGVKGQAEETGPSDNDRLVDGKPPGKKVTRYDISSTEPSFAGIKGFMLTQYIQTTFGGNTLLLTATPFTNSPLEIYSMLSMVAYHKLREMKLDNLTQFFDNYVQISYELIINSKLRPVRKQVIMGFNNILSLQTLIRRFINYKTGDQVPSVVKKRPGKVVLPLKTKMVDGVLMTLPEEKQSNTALQLTPLQSEYMDQIMRYANGEISDAVLCSGTMEEEEETSETTASVEADEENMSAQEKAGVRTLKAMSHARNLALSPYIFECSGLGVPTATEYIETSNKLMYVMGSIRTMKAYHEKHNEPMSGVIIYMDRGKKYFPKIKEYLVKKLGFASHEVGIMGSGVMEPTKKGMNTEDQKEYIKNLFLGLEYNEDTREMEVLPAEKRIKIIIGSSMIREGINLQAHTSTLFNCWLEWNPSDLQQLYGRLFRQGNKFKTVRLVVPLMIDSMDIFMFQKLEEKTSRINTVWESDGETNVFNTEEFSPHDLKFALIKDPMVLAEMDLQEKAELLDEKIADIRNNIKKDQAIIDYQHVIEVHSESLFDWLEQYRPTKSKNITIDKAIKMAQDVIRKQIGPDGKPMVYQHSQKTQFDDDGNRIWDYYSKLSPAHKPGYFDNLNYALRNLKREERDYLIPNGYSVKSLPSHLLQLEQEIKDTQEQKITLTGEEAIKERANEIIEYRTANAVKERTLSEVINDFAKLNHLLSDVRTPPVKASAVPKTTVKAKEQKATKEDFEKSIKGFKVALKYAKGEQKKNLQATLRGFEIAVKYWK